MRFFALLCVTASLHAEVSHEYIAHKQEQKAAKEGVEVAVYAYPLVMMGLLKHYDTYSPGATEYKAPVNQFAHQKTQATPLDNTLCYPTIDTLHSNAWLDLSNGPIMLHVPQVYKRFFLFELFDGWTNVAATIDQPEKDYMIAGPDFKGQAPKDTILIRSKTNMAYLKGQTQCFGPKDYAAVQAIQAGYTLSVAPTITPVKGPNATREAPRELVKSMAFSTFFNRFGELLKTNPPSCQDVVIAKTMSDLGIIPGARFDAEDTKDPEERGLHEAFTDALEKLDSKKSDVFHKRSQWEMLFRKESDFGTDYLRRALIAQASLPASLAQNMLSAKTSRDNNGNRLNGLNHYRMHFSKEEVPQVKAFWSLTLYTDFQALSYNKDNIYAIQSFSDSLVVNKDGSLDIFIQHEKPEEPKCNWLPCPKETFELVFRLYQPEAKLLDSNWMPQPVIEQ